MEFERKIYKEILDWKKNSNGKTALLIEGARRVGKSTIARKIGKTYKSYVVIDFSRASKNIKNVFENSLNNLDIFFQTISLEYDIDLYKRESLIIFDEVQRFPRARETIKLLVEDGRYDYIETGSLISLKENVKDILIPSEEEKIKMYPLDFEEFLLAFNISKKTFNYLNNCFDNKVEVDDIIHKQMMEIFKLYLIVGGMPKAVQTFVDTKDIFKVNKVLEEIYVGYKKDITKYQKENKLNIEEIFDLIPSELNNTNKRFILKDLNSNSRFYKYETSFTWLKNSNVGLFVHNVDEPKYPLLASKERTLFKLFYLDVGLLTYKLLNGNQAEILNSDFDFNKGSIYEAVVASELKAHRFELYYNNNKKRGEIDFLIEINNKVVPIEVKSGKDYKVHRAINNLLNNKEFNYDYGYVLSNNNLSVDNKLIYLPIYMICFIKQNTLENEKIINIDISKLI